MSEKKDESDEGKTGQPPTPKPNPPSVPIWRRALACFSNIEAIKIFTAVLAIAAMVNVWVIIESERAFVFPSETNFTVPKSVEQLPFSLYLVVENHGRSVARIKDIKGFITTDALPPVPNYTTGQTRIRIAFPPIPPKGKIRRILNFDGGPLAIQTTGEVRAGTRKFYLFGRIDYRDGYSVLLGGKQSAFCFVFIPAQSVFDTCPHPEYTKPD